MSIKTKLGKGAAAERKTRAATRTGNFYTKIQSGKYTKLQKFTHRYVNAEDNPLAFISKAFIDNVLSKLTGHKSQQKEK